MSSWIDDRFRGGHEVYFYAVAKSRPAEYQAIVAADEVWQGWFSADGRTLITCDYPGVFTRHRVEAEAPRPEFLWENPDGHVESASMSVSGTHVLANGFKSKNAWMIAIDGSQVVDLGTLFGEVGGLALEPNLRRAAVGGGNVRPRMPDEPVIRVIDLETREEQVLRGDGESGFLSLRFLPGNRLLALSIEGIYLWDLTTGTSELLSDRSYWWANDVSGDLFIADSDDGVTLLDLEQREERVLPIPTERVACLALSPDGSYAVVGTHAGEVLVLDLDSEVPHELLGHDDTVFAIWISPDGEEIRSASRDGTVRVWERPKSEPVHNLPHDEFMALIRAQTNMRAVPDFTTDEGYRIEYDEFPGWAQVPPEW